MAQRRVVTENVNGRSRVASDQDATRLDFGVVFIDELWISSTNEPLGSEPTDEDIAVTPPAGSLHWRIFSLPPDGLLGGRVPEDRPEGLNVASESGWQKTDTLDYVVVLDGDITLVLEEGEVELHPGDCVVQRQTNHAWRNKGDSSVCLLAVMAGMK